MIILVTSLRKITLPAYFILGYWFATQVFSYMTRSAGGVIFWAHVGGIVAGLIHKFMKKKAITKKNI